MQTPNHTFWLEFAQTMTFPDWMPNTLRTKIRAKVVALPLMEDDMEDLGLVVSPPSNYVGESPRLGMCVTHRRIAKAYKEILGEDCGTPPVENIEHILDFVDEQNERDDYENGEENA